MAKHVAKYRRDKNDPSNEGWWVAVQHKPNIFEYVRKCLDEGSAGDWAFKMNRVGEEA